MPPKFYKHKLLLDEGLFKRQSLKRLNSRYNLNHINHDLHKGGINDNEVHEIACKEKRVIITYNVKHFKSLAKLSKNTGIIGITRVRTPEQLDIQLTSLLSKSAEKSLYGKYTTLS